MARIQPLPREKVKYRYKPQFGVVVVVESEAAQREAYDRLRTLGFACRVVTV